MYETAQTYPLLAASESVMLAGSTVDDAVRASMEEIGGLEASRDQDCIRAVGYPLGRCEGRRG
jgi:hypothetical protein